MADVLPSMPLGRLRWLMIVSLPLVTMDTVSLFIPYFPDEVSLPPAGRS